MNKSATYEMIRAKIDELNEMTGGQYCLDRGQYKNDHRLCKYKDGYPLPVFYFKTYQTKVDIYEQICVLIYGIELGKQLKTTENNIGVTNGIF